MRNFILVSSAHFVSCVMVWADDLNVAGSSPADGILAQLGECVNAKAEMELRIHTFVLKCHLVGFKEVKTPPRAITIKTNTMAYATPKANRRQNLGIPEVPKATPNANHFGGVADNRNFPDFRDPENEKWKNEKITKLIIFSFFHF